MNLKNEFKRDSISIKKWNPTYLLPDSEIIVGSLAFTIKVSKCACYRKIMKHKNLTKHYKASNLLNRLEFFKFCTYKGTKEIYEIFRER